MKKNLNKNKELLILIFLSSILLFIAVDNRFSEGFYTLLRIIVTATSCYIIYLEFVKKNIFFYLFVATAVLFNPIIQLHFRRDTWQIIDVLSILLFITYLIYIVIKFFKAKDTKCIK